VAEKSMAAFHERYGSGYCTR
jgi:hypothetical protein